MAMNGGLTIVPGSERLYVLDFGDNGQVSKEPQPRRSREVREHELVKAERRLRPLIRRGEEAERRLEAEHARRLRELRDGCREFADVDDPEATDADNRLYREYRAWKRDGR
jgi:hypothetical protein